MTAALLIDIFILVFTPRREGTLDSKLHWYPKFYTLVCWLNSKTNFMNFNCLVSNYKVLYDFLKSIILIYRNINIVYHNWGFTSIYCPLSYPLNSLVSTYSISFFEEWWHNSSNWSLWTICINGLFGILKKQFHSKWLVKHSNLPPPYF